MHVSSSSSNQDPHPYHPHDPTLPKPPAPLEPASGDSKPLSPVGPNPLLVSEKELSQSSIDFSNPKYAGFRKLVVAQPGDSFYKTLMKHPLLAIQVLLKCLPKEILELYDINTLKVEPGSFVTSKLRQLHTDVLYSLQRIGSDDPADVLYCLLEHQSNLDTDLLYRNLCYLTSISQDHFEKYKSLPIVSVTVLHYSNRKVEENSQLTDYCYSKDPQLHALKQRLHGCERFTILRLFNINTPSEEDHSKTLACLQLFEMAMGHHVHEDVYAFINLLEKARIHEGFTDKMLNDAYIFGISEAITRGAPGKPFEMFRAIPYLESRLNRALANRKAEDMSIIACLEELQKHERAQGVEQGIEQGIERGIERGIEQGLKLGIKQIARNMSAEGFSDHSILRALNISPEALEELKRTP